MFTILFAISLSPIRFVVGVLFAFVIRRNTKPAGCHALFSINPLNNSVSKFLALTVVIRLLISHYTIDAQKKTKNGKCNLFVSEGSERGYGNASEANRTTDAWRMEARPD